MDEPLPNCAEKLDQLNEHIKRLEYENEALREKWQKKPRRKRRRALKDNLKALSIVEDLKEQLAVMEEQVETLRASNDMLFRQILEERGFDYEQGL